MENEHKAVETSVNVTENPEKVVVPSEKISISSEERYGKFKANNEALIAWDDTRCARERNEKAILEVMLTAMEEKLEIGKSACNDLLKYMRELVRAQQDWMKSFGKLGNALDERLHYGSLENAVVTLKQQSISACSIYEEHNKILTDTIANQLSNLVSDYTKQANKLIDSARKSSKEYDQARETSSKAFNTYVTAFNEHLAMEKHGIVPSHDPWMSEKIYHASLEALKIEREKCATELEAIFARFMTLEEKRVEGTKEVIQVHASKQKLIYGRLSEGMTALEQVTYNVDTVTDRQLLLKQSFNRRVIAQSQLHKLSEQVQQMKDAQSTKPAHIQHLADLEAQHRALRADLAGTGAWSLSQSGEIAGTRTSGTFQKQNSNSTFDQMSSAPLPLPPKLEKEGSLSTMDQKRMSLEVQKEQNFSFKSTMEIPFAAPNVMEPAKSGYLFRKSQILKSWKQAQCVLSSSGYLYIFPGLDQQVEPKYTVALTDVSVQQLKDTEEPNVFELIVNKNSYFSSTKFVLQAESKEALNDWISNIHSYSGNRK